MAHLLIVQSINLKKNIISFKKENKTLSAILRHISIFTGEKTKDIVSRSRKRELADARALFCSYCYEYTKNSLSKIGDIVNISHSSVLVNNNKRKNVLESEYDRFKEYMRMAGYKMEYTERAMNSLRKKK